MKMKMKTKMTKLFVKKKKKKKCNNQLRSFWTISAGTWLLPWITSIKIEVITITVHLLNINFLNIGLPMGEDASIKSWLSIAVFHADAYTTDTSYEVSEVSASTTEKPEKTEKEVITEKTEKSEITEEKNKK